MNSGDLLSRQAVIKAIYDNNDRLNIAQAIRELPSVNPQEPKTGCWEYGYAFADGKYGKCSECKEIIKCIYPMHYCPNCGARMESEDKDASSN